VQATTSTPSPYFVFYLALADHFMYTRNVSLLLYPFPKESFYMRSTSTLSGCQCHFSFQ
jgi:hypothetical protein